MKKNKVEGLVRRLRFPHVGQRMIKTTVAVFICLLIYYFRGYRGADMPSEAALTAIVCMQPFVSDSKEFAISRMASTLVGAVWGLIFVLLLMLFPGLGGSVVLLYAVMSLGVLATLYTTVLLKRQDASGLAAIVYICLVITFPEIDEPLEQMVIKVLDVFIGTVVAIVVNVFRLPREINPGYVFFIRVRDLVPDRFAQIPPSATFRLNQLSRDGAKICLMSRHAPAFFALQMNSASLRVPMIVMDGAAIYDCSKNAYLSTVTIPTESFDGLRTLLEGRGRSYFTYTIHKNRVCIFHHGDYDINESVILERMRSSPYRSYLEEEIYRPEEIVYLKVIMEDAAARALERELAPKLEELGLRSSVMGHADAPGISGLYLYSKDATMQAAEKRLMTLLREREPWLKPADISMGQGYRSEHDTLQLLHMVEDIYEPVRLFRRKNLPTVRMDTAGADSGSAPTAADNMQEKER